MAAPRVVDADTGLEWPGRNRGDGGGGGFGVEGDDGQVGVDRGVDGGTGERREGQVGVAAPRFGGVPTKVAADGCVPGRGHAQAMGKRRSRPGQFLEG